MRKYLLLFVAAALNTYAAGPLIFGVRGGIQVTDNSNGLFGSAGLTASNVSPLVGPTAGVRLGRGFSVEGDALFNRQSISAGRFAGFDLGTAHVNSWQIPIMAKYTFGEGAIAPVLGAGVSIRHIDGLGSSSFFGNIPSYLLNGTTASNTAGFVAGGGVRFKTGPIEITPEARYTRWSNGSGAAQSILNVLSPNRNQAQILVGLTF
ncbi:MAG: hypothetical protein ACM336_01140 [Acidobacteriota bacterium]